MKVLKSIAVAFSMYSRIPMPRFNWDSEDMKYHLIFFPWIGALIGIVEYLWRWFSRGHWLHDIAYTAVVLAIPIIITGGFHIDGFMDTSDALSSYRDREKRLEILKDSHVGAFAIINLAVLGLFTASGVSMMISEKSFLAWNCSFVISRCLSGIAVVCFKNAKEAGLLKTEADNSAKKTVLTWLILELFLAGALMVSLGKWYGLAGLIVCLLVFLMYRHMAYSKFGGITGDLAGWFVCMLEMCTAFVIGVGASIWY